MEVRIPTIGEVSNPKIYKFDPDDKKEKRMYRHEKAREDIDKRLNVVSTKVGTSFNIGANQEKIQISALVKIIMAKGIINEVDFADVFWITADEATRSLEANIEQLKSAKAKKELMGRLVTGPKIHREDMRI